MRLILLQSIVLGSCFMSIQAQDESTTDPTISSSYFETVETTLNDESTRVVTPGNTVTELMTDTDVVHSEPTQDYQMSTEMEHSTTGETTKSVAEIEQTTPKSVPELTPAQEETTTTTLETIPTTGMTDQATSDFMPTTSMHETSMHEITSADLTSSSHQEYETTTATAAMTTGLIETHQHTTITSIQPTDMTESPPITSQTVDITTEASSIISTIYLISTSFFVQFDHDPEVHPTTSGGDFLSIHSTPSNTVANVGGSILPAKANWLLIIIVCAVIICALFAFMIVFIQRRKKTASQKFGPTMNGQNNKFKKKKGAGNDAWAGPVYLRAEEGLECNGEEQGALMCDENRNGEDVVLSTFTVLDTDDQTNGGVGGDGTREAKKWEEQEPLPYIDEDVKDQNMDKTEGQEVNEKVANGDKMLNGETFCITTAV